MKQKPKGAERKQRDYQEELTIKFMLRIEEAISNAEKGLKWEKPWFTCDELPWNALTEDRYSGCNIVSLMSERWTDPRWMTFMQIGELGRKLNKKLYVRSGEKSSFVMKTIPVYERDEDGEIIKGFDGQPIPVCYKDGTPKLGFKWYAVFNAQQIAGGLDPYVKIEREVQPVQEVEILAKAMQQRTGLVIDHSARAKAMYQLGAHRIHMPDRELFDTDLDYAGCLLHELAHSTGPALNREMGGSFGSPSYAYEELVAELTASFMSVELGIKSDFSSHENSVAYMKSWLDMLKMDKYCLIKASGQASKAVSYQLDHLKAYTEGIAPKKAFVPQPEPEPINGIGYKLRM